MYFFPVCKLIVRLPHLRQRPTTASKLDASARPPLRCQGLLAPHLDQCRNVGFGQIPQWPIAKELAGLGKVPAGLAQGALLVIDLGMAFEIGVRELGEGHRVRCRLGLQMRFLLPLFGGRVDAGLRLQDRFPGHLAGDGELGDQRQAGEGARCLQTAGRPSTGGFNLDMLCCVNVTLAMC